MARPISLSRTDRVFVLTGAGVSAESGLKTFRDAGGLWEEHRVEDVATPEAWHRDPALVWRFYSERRRQAETCQPNAAHRALAQLGETLGDRLFLCTQNVDPLHERAGSRRVRHMHGELFRSRCEKPSCARPPFEDHALYFSAEEILRCACGGKVRPHICWFGEVPFGLDAIGEALAACDVFLTVGSSGSVYPAAGFVSAVKARLRPARTMYVGPEEPENHFAFDEVLLGKAGEVLPSLFD
jgi:NAD-dependent deacetylase